MNYEQAIAFLQSFPDFERGLPGKKPTRNLRMPLKDMLAFLESIGNPQNVVKTIHVTGSKGKGSTSTFITNILQKAGFKTALFTSPHIHSYTERLAFNLQPISENFFAQGITELQPYIEEFDEKFSTMSTFGILTALFFYLVSKAKPPIDWQIVEVGLGGKDDVTNVFEKKEAVVIAPISLEHTAILGTTRKAIAEIKAGIIMPNCLTILAKQKDPEVEKIIQEVCLEKQSQFISVTATSLPSSIKLHGAHQIENAATALTLAYALQDKGYKITEAAISEGLSSTFLPGRFEIIEPNPSTKNDWHFSIPIVLDGAHNGDSALALAQTLENVFPERPVLFILGLNQDKNLEDIFLALKNKARKIIVTKSKSYRSMSTQEISERILACDNRAHIVCTIDMNEALEAASEELLPDDIICVCGSFYLVAEAREILVNDSPQSIVEYSLLT